MTDHGSDSASAITMTEHSSDSASAISWKVIESAQIKIIKDAFRLRYKKDSKLISEYAGYVKNLRQEEKPDEYIKSTAIMLFQMRKHIIKNGKISKMVPSRPMTEAEIDEAIDNVLADS
ncbi:12085_t:CDS:2 [Ambispora gerdemannii]|uniref:12085_t:CDS:1 n=1 Tax=Ambispora gerdemannii TaxID=144530 RepID=A0A9N8VQ41_9GLOM|nr:12085_t:CDS:2 [Ambispora gerdemannii]